MTGRDVDGRDGLSGRRQGGRRPASRPVRAVTGDSRAASKRHMPREPAASAMRQQRPAPGTCPSPEQTPSSSGWQAWHSGCQRAPAIRRPEVETFRSARRTGAICESPPNRPGESGVPWPPGRHCAESAGGTARRSMTSSSGWREPAAFWQPRRYRRQAEQMRAAKTDADSAIREFAT